MTDSWYVLEHKSCEHIAGAGTEPRSLEAQLQMLTAAGYYRWRVRRVPPDELTAVVLKVLADEKCSTCTVDVSRATMPGVAEHARAAAEIVQETRTVVVTPNTAIDDLVKPPMVGKPGTRGSGPYESAFAIAVVDEQWAIEQARQVAHDTVITNAGHARRSGVQWTHYTAATAVEDLADYGIDKLPELAQLCALFPAGVVVMATVSVDESVTP